MSSYGFLTIDSNGDSYVCLPKCAPKNPPNLPPKTKAQPINALLETLV
jgi:hypothetical protein